MSLVDIINAISSWAQSLIGTLGYPGLAFVMFLENVFPPIPSEIILPLAGFMTTAQNTTGVKFNLWAVVLVGCLGSVAGAWVFYGLARWLGEDRTRFLFRKVGKFLLLKEEDFDRALVWFKKYKGPVIFFGRLIPIIRSLISIPAGIAKMNPLTFTLFTAVGTALWSLVLALAGRLLGESWPVVSEFIDKYQNFVLVLLALLVFYFIATRVIKIIQKRNAKKNELK